MNKVFQPSKSASAALAARSGGKSDDKFDRLLRGLDNLSAATTQLKSARSEKRAAGFSVEERVRRVGRWVQAEIGSDDARSWCLANGLTVGRAQGQGVNSSGGALVPDEISDVIIKLRDSRGAFRAAAKLRRMRSDTRNVPRRLTGLTASFVAENAAAAESSMSWDSVKLVAKKISVLTKISAELEEDAAFDVGLEFLEEISYAFASKEDDCGINGDGTSTYGGIRGLCPLILDGAHNAGKIAAASGHNTFATIDNSDLTTLMSNVPANALPGARWFVSQRGYALAICRLAAAAGGIVTMNVDGVLTPTFLGFPVTITQVLPQVTSSLTGSVMLAFGDLSLAASLGDRRSVRLRFSTHRYLDTDQVAVLGTERFDIIVHDLGDNTTAGPVVGLIGTA